MTSPKPGSAPTGAGSILRLIGAYRTSAAIVAGLELGLFAALAEGPLGAEAAAARVGAASHGVRTLLNVLVTSGLVVREGAAYALSPAASAHLVPGAAGYLGEVVPMLAEPRMWGDFRLLAETLRRGGEAPDADADANGHPFWQTFARHSVSLASAAAAALARQLAPWLEARPATRVLDVACGAGVYGLTLAQHSDRVEATMLDWPQVLDEARRRAGQLGVAERTRYLEGDLRQIAFGGPYDLVLLSNIMHHFDRPSNVALARRAAAALAPGGRLVVQALVDDDSHASAMFSLMMLTLHHRGTIYGADEYASIIVEAGFLPPASFAGYSNEPARFFVADLP
jgi:2-polyprenyl-3-methyl-5-hydroxy-6-metoxy-1,4-benzoquinol methylase